MKLLLMRPSTPQTPRVLAMMKDLADAAQKLAVGIPFRLSSKQSPDDDERER